MPRREHEGPTTETFGPASPAGCDRPRIPRGKWSSMPDALRAERKAREGGPPQLQSRRWCRG
eukprot:5509410-Alexandrium_andersonii.AAC.1